ncbi:MAG: hypothetical protein AB7Q29_16085 [Vicinamibacterales bacterium]
MKRSDFFRILGLTGLAAKLLPAKVEAAPSGVLPAKLAEQVCLYRKLGPLETALRAASHDYRWRHDRVPEVFWGRERTAIELFEEVAGAPMVVNGYQRYRYDSLDFIHRDCVPEGVFIVGRRCVACYGLGYIEPLRYGAITTSGPLPDHEAFPWDRPVRPCTNPSCEAPK